MPSGHVLLRIAVPRRVQESVFPSVGEKEIEKHGFLREFIEFL